MKKFLHTLILVSAGIFVVISATTMQVSAQEWVDGSTWDNYTPTYNGNTNFVDTTCYGCDTTTGGTSWVDNSTWNNYTPTYNGNTNFVDVTPTYTNGGTSWIDNTTWNNYTPTYNGNTNYVDTTCIGCNTPTYSNVPTYTNTTTQYDYPSYTYTPSYSAPSYTYTPSNYSYPTYPYPTVTQVACPAGTTLVNGQCINTINGQVITNTICPTGTTLNGNTCVNTVTGNVVTNTVCPTGTTLANGQCINTINGQVVTNTVCPTGTTLSGNQCINTVTPPVTTVTNCPSNTNFVNGVCQQIINPPVVVTQTCWNGAVIPATQACAPQYKTCANGASVPVTQTCYVPSTPVYVPPQVVKFNNVVTSIATQITNTSGRCNGIGLIANNAQSTGWFEYGDTPALGKTTASATIGSASTAPFSNVLANLKPSTRYYCRAVMQNQYGIVKGEIVSFVTTKTVTTYVKPVTTVKKPVTTTKPVTPVKKNEVACVDGTTVKVTNQSASTLINKGEKLVTLQIDKVDGTLSSGSVVKYKVSYKNLVDTRLTGFVVKVTLPQEIIFSSTNAGTYDEMTRTITLNQDTIDPYTEGIILISGTVMKDAPLGKTTVTNAYAVYTVPGTTTQDEITAYVIGSIVPTVDTTNKETGAKKVVGVSSEKGFMPNSLIEWLALLAILFIIFILGRSIYASYKEDGTSAHH
jgi:hypothetical protein